MTKIDLQEKIKNLIQNESGINLFFVLSNKDDSVVIKRADLQVGVTQEDLKKQYIDRLENDFGTDSNIEILPLSQEDDRKNAIYQYDYDEFPVQLRYFTEFNYEKSKIETFSFKNDNLRDIEAYLIVIGSSENYLVLYKKFYPIFFMGQKQFFIKRSEKRFEKIEDDFLRIDDNYQLLQIDGEIYIKNLDVFEKISGFKELVIAEAKKAIETIEGLELLEETDALSESIEDNIAFARKVRNVCCTSPIIKNKIPNKTIVEFSKTFPGLKKKLKYSEDGTKIMLTTKKSQEIFLKILDDSYLTSELTKLYYDTMAKTQMEE